METFRALTNSELRVLIDDRVRGPRAERNRAILKRRLLDGLTYERIAEEFEMSVRQIKSICRRTTGSLTTE